MPKAETEGHLAFNWDIQIVKELSVHWALFSANHLGNPTLHLGSAGIQ